MAVTGVEPTKTGSEVTKLEFVVNVARVTQGSARTQLCPGGHFG